jgi:hypothetical protein
LFASTSIIREAYEALEITLAFKYPETPPQLSVSREFYSFGWGVVSIREYLKQGFQVNC